MSDSEARWRERLDRERRARRAAEEVAERGMRELWLANQRLEQSVSDRTAELERLIERRAIEDRARAVVIHGFAAALDVEVATQIRAVVQLGAEQASVPTTATAGAALGEWAARWQKRAARQRLLLVTECADPGEVYCVDWLRVGVAVDALLGAAVRVAGPGSLVLAVRGEFDASDNLALVVSVVEPSMLESDREACATRSGAIAIATAALRCTSGFRIAQHAGRTDLFVRGSTKISDESSRSVASVPMTSPERIFE